MGDFSKIGEVADMYRHCKATEDTDMGFEDFITEHVLNLKIEDIFEKHYHEKEHQSSKSSPYQHVAGNSIQMMHKALDRYIIVPVIKVAVSNSFFSNNDPIIAINYGSGIFRPPVVS